MGNAEFDENEKFFEADSNESLFESIASSLADEVAVTLEKSVGQMGEISE